ncbi:MAG: hypothetical protein KDC71_12745 [Acidobacteria bacterium]|nr:hypothetical protein [Acidobacteriota bacterium]
MNLQSSSPPVWLFVLLPIFFVGLWLGIIYLLRWFSGWGRLAESYQHDEEPSHIFRFESAYVGWVRFNGVLNLGITKSGLYLRPMFVFKLFHPGLLIPWQQLELDPRPRWFGMRRFRIKSHPKITLDLYPRGFQRVVGHVSEAPSN